MAYDILKRTQELRDQQNSKLSSVTHSTDLKKLRIEDAGGKVPEPKDNKGFLFKVADLYDRPANALRVGANNYFQGKYVGKGFMEGLKGKQHVYGSEILDSAGMQAGKLRSGLGFAIDMVADPNMLVGGPLVKAGSKALVGATKAGGAANTVAKAVNKSGLIGATVKAPFSVVDKGLTRAGANPVMKSMMKPTNNPFVKGVEKLGSVGDNALGRAYVHGVELTGNIRPNFVSKNFDPNLAKGVFNKNTKGVKIAGKRTTASGRKRTMINAPQLEYEQGRRYLKSSTKAARSAGRASEQGSITAVRRYGKDFGHLGEADQILIRDSLEALPLKLEDSINTLKQGAAAGRATDAVAARELGVLARMDMGTLSKRRKYVKALGQKLEDSSTYIDMVAKENLAKAAQAGRPMSAAAARKQAEKTYITSYEKFVSMNAALGHYDDAARLAAKELSDLKVNNPEMHKLVVQARKRFVKMAEKEGLGTKRVAGYVPRYAETARIPGLDGGKSVQAGGTAAIKRLLNQGIDSHKKRGFITTRTAVAAGKASYDDAGRIAQAHLAKQGIDVAARDAARTGAGSKFAKLKAKALKAQQAGDNIMADSYRREMAKMTRQFTVDDMADAIGKGLNPMELPPVFHVAESFGEGWLQREMQHNQLRASQILMKDLQSKGTALKVIPNAKAQYDSKMTILEKLRQTQGPLSPGDQRLFNQLVQETGDLKKYLGTTRQFINAGDLGLKGAEQYMVHPQVAATVNRMGGALTMTKELSDVRKLYRKALGIFKHSVTGLNPGWYVTNFVGNVYNAYLGGLTDWNRYRMALMGQTGTPSSMVKLTKYLEKNKVLSVAGLKKGKGGYMTADEFMDIVHKQGLTGFGTSYDNLGRTYDTIARKSAQAAKRADLSTAGKIKSYVKTDVMQSPVEFTKVIGDTMESNAKIAMFMDDLIKSAKTGKNMTYNQMKAQTIRSRDHALKYLFDYSDLTQAEGLIKDFIPFYTYQRKNIPLQIEALMKQPHKFAQMHKLREGSLQDKLTEEQRDKMPEWLRAKAIGIGSQGKVFTPNLPSESIDDMLDPRAMMGMITPAFIKPLEVMANQNFFTGAPIRKYEGQTVKSIMGEQDPRLVHILNTLGYTRGLNTALQDLNSGEERAVSGFANTSDPFTQSLLKAVGRTYNPDINDLNYEYGVDRQLADAIKALKAQGVDVRTATEILKGQK